MIRIQLSELKVSTARTMANLLSLDSKMLTEIENGVIRGAMMIQSQAVKNAPVKTGTLRRSIHVSNDENSARHSNDLNIAKRRRIPSSRNAEVTNSSITAYIGSWLNYALIREIKSILSWPNKGNYRYMYRALKEKAKSASDYVIKNIEKVLK